VNRIQFTRPHVYIRRGAHHHTSDEPGRQSRQTALRYQE